MVGWHSLTLWLVCLVQLNNASNRKDREVMLGKISVWKNTEELPQSGKFIQKSDNFEHDPVTLSDDNIEKFTLNLRPPVHIKHYVFSNINNNSNSNQRKFVLINGPFQSDKRNNSLPKLSHFQNKPTKNQLSSSNKRNIIPLINPYNEYDIAYNSDKLTRTHSEVGSVGTENGLSIPQRKVFQKRSETNSPKRQSTAKGEERDSKRKPLRRETAMPLIGGKRTKINENRSFQMSSNVRGHRIKRFLPEDRSSSSHAVGYMNTNTKIEDRHPSKDAGPGTRRMDSRAVASGVNSSDLDLMTQIEIIKPETRPKVSYSSGYYDYRTPSEIGKQKDSDLNFHTTVENSNRIEGGSNYPVPNHQTGRVNLVRTVPRNQGIIFDGLTGGDQSGFVDQDSPFGSTKDPFLHNPKSKNYYGFINNENKFGGGSTIINTRKVNNDKRYAPSQVIKNNGRFHRGFDYLNTRNKKEKKKKPEPTFAGNDRVPKHLHDNRPAKINIPESIMFGHPGELLVPMQFHEKSPMFKIQESTNMRPPPMFKIQEPSNMRPPPMFKIEGTPNMRPPPMLKIQESSNLNQGHPFSGFGQEFNEEDANPIFKRGAEKLQNPSFVSNQGIKHNTFSVNKKENRKQKKQSQTFEYGLIQLQNQLPEPHGQLMYKNRFEKIKPINKGTIFRQQQMHNNKPKPVGQQFPKDANVQRGHISNTVKASVFNYRNHPKGPIEQTEKQNNVGKPFQIAHPPIHETDHRHPKQLNQSMRPDMRATATMSFSLGGPLKS